jgi:hypothetical protein
VIADARAAGDVELLARAVLLLASDVRPGVVDRQQVALLEEARAALGDRAPALGCRVVARLATAYQPAPDPAMPRALARDVRARAEALGDPAVIADVLELAGWGIYDAPLAERTAWAAELLERALAAAQLDKALVAYDWLAFDHIEAGDFGAFDRDVAAMLQIADELGHPRYRWRPLLVASMQATMNGRFAESDRYVTEIEQLAPLTDDPALAISLPLHKLLRASILRRDDEVRTACATVDAALRPLVNAPVIAASMRGVCLARIGDVAGAKSELALIGARMPLAALHESSLFDPVIATLGEHIAAAGSEVERKNARIAVARITARHINGGQMPYSYDGPVARVLGLLDASLGDLAGAERALRDALELSRGFDHRPWIAQIAHELATVLARIGRGADARAFEDEAQRIAHELGMPGLAKPDRGDDAPLRCERSGHEWRIVRGASAIAVKDSRGMQLLARLVDNAGEELHVLALASDEGTAAPDSNAGEILDERARKAYRRRLGELADALADAEARGDAKRATAIERERDALVAELARATGLGGRARTSASATERARVNVQKRIRDAIARIGEADAELGRFFERTVRTGTFCCFRP